MILLNFTVMLGILLVIAGVLSILKHLFNWNIPIGKIIFASFVIWLGIILLINPRPKMRKIEQRKRADSVRVEDAGSYAFSGRELMLTSDAPLEDGAYEMSFGSLLVDFSDVILKNGVTEISLSVNFGALEIIVDEDVPVRIESSAAFGGVEIHGRGTGGVAGEYEWESESFKTSPNKLIVYADAAFGAVNVRY